MSYLQFTQCSDTGKTKKYDTQNKTNGVKVGRVSFYPMWRKYVFRPEPDCLFDSGCLKEISDFIDGVQADWRKGLKDK